MSRLERLARAKGEGRKLLVPFFTGGYPDAETFAALLFEAEAAGADAVEVGIPFSDPSADGPVIQAASERALKAGTTVKSIFAAVKSAREKGLAIPLLYMTYYNPILHHGTEAFARDAAASGADGVLVVDLPAEEAGEFAPLARAAGLDTIFLVAPTTPAARVPFVLDGCGGFVYCVSVTGVTGSKKPAADMVAETVARVRPVSTLPVLVGFGVADADSARKLAAVADGVIVGSALLQQFEGKRGAEAVRAAGAFLRELRSAV